MKKILLLSAVAASVFATEYQVGVGFGRNNVSNSAIKNYNYANFRVGKYLPKNHILRFELEKSTSIKTNTQNSSLSRVFLNVEHYFNTNNKFTPYAFVGGGYQWIKGAYDNSAVVDLGAGIKYKFTQQFDGFVEAKGMRDFHNNDNHFGFLIGVVFNFDNEKRVPVVEIEPMKKAVKKVIDSDNDGVVDNLDKCPNTIKGVKVDKNGCAFDSDNDGVADYIDKCPNTIKGVKVDKNGCAFDSDKDGIPDYIDKCPNTPKGVNVYVNGCAVDSDKDGIADYIDKCPNTPKGMQVDKNGCEVSYNFGITFDNNSAKIKSEFIPKIERFAEFLKSHPNIKAQIQGFTDNKGNEQHNLILSQRRAKAVYEALIKLGVDKNQLSWAGYGVKNPIASNGTKEGRSQNRRVVAKLKY